MNILVTKLPYQIIINKILPYLILSDYDCKNVTNIYGYFKWDICRQVFRIFHHIKIYFWDFDPYYNRLILHSCVEEIHKEEL